MENITDNALRVLEKRYLVKDETGKCIETVEGMLRRVAKAIAKGSSKWQGNSNKEDYCPVSKDEEVFFEMMANMEFLPNSPTLMNAGRPLGQLSGCFVLPVEDNTESIFDAIKYSALIHKSGGGTGFSFTRLRPNGSVVRSTNGVASGPISFLKVFNAATECIKQGGVRRGANMGILRIDHPDIISFIECKRKNTEITNFNLSVALTEGFMRAVENNEDYNIIDPRTKDIVGKLNAKEVFELIVDGAYNNGEPGIIFLDRINEENPTPWLGEIEATNPCGEQPLLPYESCNLGSINLAKMVKKTDNGYEFDWDYLDKTVCKAVKFLDNVVEVNNYPLPAIDKMTRSTRKIGLGVMGWADSLIMMGIPYNCDQAIELAEKVMQFINDAAEQESMRLAQVRGAYPASHNEENTTYAVRNAARTTIAPTGTLSIIADCSSGVEPLFAVAFERWQADMRMKDVNPLFRSMMEERGLEVTEEMIDRIMKAGTIRAMNDIPIDIRAIFTTAHDVAPGWHVKMQAAFQKHTNNAVSKTVNLPHDATKEDVRKVYWLAYKLGCKGVTLYRDGSRDEQVLSTGASYTTEDKGEMRQEQAEYQEYLKTAQLKAMPAEPGQPSLQVQSAVVPRKRPDTTTGFTDRVQIGCGKLYVTVNYDDQGICEVFTNTGRAGGCPSQSEAVSRLVSLALRAGIDPKAIVDQLKGIRCPSTVGKGLGCTSCPDAIGRLIERVSKQLNSQNMDITPVVVKATAGEKLQPGDLVSLAKCPECGKPVEHEGGCMVCRNCGFSKCG
jgi:ribonucleoside-diphosphate reductase alpha chain